MLVQAYFWLWPGGRSDQVSSAAFKQDVGHNPASGLDKCAEGERVGAFASVWMDGEWLLYLCFLQFDLGQQRRAWR